MAREKIKYEKTLMIGLTQEGEPHFEFTGIWSAGLLERMMRKAQRALRQSKVKMAQEAQAARALTNEAGEEKDNG